MTYTIRMTSGPIYLATAVEDPETGTLLDPVFNSRAEWDRRAWVRLRRSGTVDVIVQTRNIESIIIHDA